MDAHTVLQCASELNVTIRSGTNIQVSVGGTDVCGSAHTLAILDVFSQPLPVAEALKILRPRVTGAQDWMDLTNSVMELYRAGVLIDANQGVPPLDPRGWNSAGVHVAMLNDRVRTLAFLTALREAVRPGDVVLDVGTGTGILAIAAAQAGARRVYAIEASRMANTALAMFQANRVADRITLLPTWSTRLELPERADLLVTEIIGNHPLGEHFVEVVADARKRLLKPGARILPGRIRIFGLPVAIPESEVRQHAFTPDLLREWQAWYGVDFGPLGEVPGRASQVFFAKPQLACNWRALGHPVLLTEVDLKTVEAARIQQTVSVTATAAGQLNGVVGYFELDLGPYPPLSTAPNEVTETNHWKSPVWLFSRAVAVQPEQSVRLVYRHCVPGSPDGVEVVCWPLTATGRPEAENA